MGDTDMMHETLRMVMLEAVDAYRELNEGDAGAALEHLKRIADFAATHVVQSNVESVHEVLCHKWYSPCQPGYDTIIGWQMRNGNYKPDSEPTDVIHDSLLDSRIIGKYIRKFAEGAILHKVEAPAPLNDAGIWQVNAYPEDILAEVFGS